MTTCEHLLDPVPSGLVSLDSAAKEFEDFIYLVSHDIRNSVRALLELPQWIEEDLQIDGHQISGSLAENIRLMHIHTSRLDRMLIDLLVYSRIGRLQSVKEVRWEDVVDIILDETPLPPGFQLKLNLEESRYQLGETDALTLMSSLLSNAIKHHDRSEGTIRIESRDEKDWHVLSICDDGPGIPERFRSKVFEVMTTLRPRDEIDGSGMGLANVRKIVTLYQGECEWLPSPYGRGCHLAARFPRSKPFK